MAAVRIVYLNLFLYRKINFLEKNNIKVLDIITEDGDLEDVFIQLINR